MAGTMTSVTPFKRGARLGKLDAVTEARSRGGASRTTKERRPGRPRPPATDESILRATIALLAEGGPRSATIDAIAKRSGCAKTTIYRRWPSRDTLIIDSMRAAVQGTREHIEEVRELDETLGSTVHASARNIVSLVQNPVFRGAFPTIARELLDETPLGEGFRVEVFAPIRAAVRQRLHDEVLRGVIRRDIDPDLVLDLVNGAVLYRALIGESIDEGVADAIADLILKGAGVGAGEGPPEGS
jgi:AcrR family transcriptional regulator